MTNAILKVNHYLEMVRFSHTVFALPFALMGALVATNGLPKWDVLLWILICMVTARTAAMSFNRIVDRHIDRLNPRTRDRHIPSGKVSVREAAFLWLVCSALFVLSAWQLNQLAFLLSFPTLIILCGYSFMKRYTSLCHAVLGLALAIVPVGAWIAVKGIWEWEPVILAAGVLFWVTGFDVLYALLDEEFDQKQGIHSLVVRLGKKQAMRAAMLFHVVSIFFIFAFGYAAQLGWIYYGGALLYGGLIVYEHSLVSPDDISRVNIAFFNVNGVISIGMFVFTAIDLWISSL